MVMINNQGNVRNEGFRYFSFLPHEIQVYILSLLSRADVLNCRVTNRHIYTISSKDWGIWNSFLWKYFPDSCQALGSTIGQNTMNFYLTLSSAQHNIKIGQYTQRFFPRKQNLAGGLCIKGNTLYAATTDGIEVWDISGRNSRFVTTLKSDSVSECCLSCLHIHGDILCASPPEISLKHITQMWNLKSQALVDTYQEYRCFGVSSDGVFYLSSAKEIAFFDSKSMKFLDKKLKLDLKNIAFPRKAQKYDGCLYVAGQHLLQVWDLETQKLLSTTNRGRESLITCMGMYENMLYVGYSDGAIFQVKDHNQWFFKFLREAQEGEGVFKMTIYDGYLYLGGDRIITVWDLSKNERLGIYSHQSGWIHAFVVGQGCIYSSLRLSYPLNSGSIASHDFTLQPPLTSRVINWMGVDNQNLSNASWIASLFRFVANRLILLSSQRH